MDQKDRTSVSKEISNIIYMNQSFIDDAKYTCFLNALKHSRRKEVVEDPNESLEYTKWFAQNLINLQDFLLKDLSGKEDIDKQAYDAMTFWGRQSIRIFKTIYDGLVFRKLDFDHPFLRFGAEYHSPLNSNSNETIINTVNFVEQYAKDNGGYVLINDLSNFLRAGDFIHINENRIRINEIKGNFAKVLNVDSYKDKKPSGQFIKKIIPSQDILDKRYIKTSNASLSEFSIKDVSFTIKTYFPEVSRLLKKLENDYFAELIIDDYLVIRGFNMILMYEKTLINKEETLGFFGERLKYPQTYGWNTSNILHSSTYLYFTFDGEGNFSRNLIPLSTHPLDEKHILDLMLGRKVLYGWINLDSIKKHFERRGWKIEQTSIDEIYQYNELLFKRKKVDDLPFKEILKEDLFTVSRGAFTSTLSLSEVIKLFSESKRIKTLLNQFEKIYELSQEGKDEYFIVRNLEEKNVFI